MKASTSKRPRRHGAARKPGEKVGTFKYRFELAARPEGPWRAMEGIVDTGSQYTWVPGSILRELGLTPSENIEFTMAKGKPEFRDAVEAPIRLDGRVRHTICVFGGEEDLVLLGAYALEGFGLAADTVNKRLVRMPTIPAAGTADRQETEPEGGRPKWT